jgi:hypothetical protein
MNSTLWSRRDLLFSDGFLNGKPWFPVDVRPQLPYTAGYTSRLQVTFGPTFWMFFPVSAKACSFSVFQLFLSVFVVCAELRGINAQSNGYGTQKEIGYGSEF